MGRLRFVLLFCLMVGSTAGWRPAHADQTFCVDPGHSPTSLFSALQTWANSTSGTITIKVVGGTQAISVSFTQLHDPSGALVLLGGYQANSGCNDALRNVKTNATIIDGGGTGHFFLEPAAALTIDGVTFSNFYEDSGASGQGVEIYTVLSNVTLSRVVSSHNETFYVHNNNGGPLLDVRDCLVYGQPVNATAVAMRVSAQDGVATIRNCTVSGNVGGGIEMETFGNGQVNVYNTIAYSNGQYDFLAGNLTNVPNVYFSMYFNGTGFNPSSSNVVLVSTSPGFVSPGNDFHLAQGSQAINIGDPNLSYPPGETDLDGNARVSGNRIDMGAYESAYVPNQYIVNSTADTTSVGTLRWAVGQANLNAPAISTIVFNLGVSAGCPYTISLSSALPDIAGPVFVDGRTQPGWAMNTALGAFSGTLCVRVASSGPGYAFHTAASAGASQLVALGMEFAGFNQAAIRLEGGTGHNIGNNWFGGPGMAANNYGVQVLANASGAQIGGADAAFANVFDNAGGAGVLLNSALGNNIVQNNVFGVAPDGVTPEGNGLGIFVNGSPGNTLRANFIGNSSNAGSGAILLYGPATTGTLVQQNYIGWNFYGSMPNAGAGVVVSNGAHDNAIGNPTFFSTSFANSIHASGGPGVWLTAIAGSGNSVLGNDLVASGGPTGDNGLAIDLAGVGPDANTSLDAQNYPVLRNSFALANNQLVAGTLDAAPNTFYRIDFYHLNTPPLGSSGRGAAGLFAGAKGLVTDATGRCNFLLTLAGVDVGGYLSAATTPAAGNTSEIGNAVADQGDGIFLSGFGGTDACQ